VASPALIAILIGLATEALDQTFTVRPHRLKPDLPYYSTTITLAVNFNGLGKESNMLYSRSRTILLIIGILFAGLFTQLANPLTGSASIRRAAAVENTTALVPQAVDPLFSLQEKLIEEDQGWGAEFGSSIALDGDTLVVGARYDTVDHDNQGSVRVYTRSGTDWSLQQKLTSSDAAAYDAFGYSVALSGNRLVVGAIGDDDVASDRGAAYVFIRNGTVWTEVQKLAANDGVQDDRFGEAVALDGDTMVIGAKYDDISTNINEDRGAAYVFTYNGTVWTQQQKLIASDGSGQDYFGAQLALSGDTVVVGVPMDNNSEPDQGSAYVYTRSGAVWTQQQKIVAADGDYQEHFGSSVALNGNTLVVGAENDFSVGGQEGSVYVFQRNGAAWTQQQKLRADDGGAADDFGGSVAMSGDTMVVGAMFHDWQLPFHQGAAYVFTRSGAVWTQQQELNSNTGAERDRFGSDVAISGDTVVVGSTGESIGEDDNHGAAYVFFRSPCPAFDFSPSSLPDGAYGAPYHQALIVSGGTGPYQFSVSGGALPPGISLSTVGSLSGTSTAPGTYQFTVNATDSSNSCSGSHAYSITITSCPTMVLDPPVMPDGTMGEPYIETMTATGGAAPYAFATPNPPPGLSLSANGVLSGTPGEDGEFNIRIRITDANGCTTNTETLITIAKAEPPCGTLVVTPPALSNGVMMLLYSQTLTAAGGTAPYTFVALQGLPPGLSLSPAGVVSGLPLQDGFYEIRIMVTDARGCQSPAAVSITIDKSGIELPPVDLMRKRARP
jgi:hypothetical protein